MDGTVPRMLVRHTDLLLLTGVQDSRTEGSGTGWDSGCRLPALSSCCGPRTGLWGPRAGALLKDRPSSELLARPAHHTKLSRAAAPAAVFQGSLIAICSIAF